MSNILLMAIGFVGVQIMQITPEQHRSIKEIEILGGCVFFKDEGANRTIDEIGFKGHKFDDSHLRLLKPFRSIPDLRIWFSGATISDKGLHELADFDELGGLSFSGAEISDHGILALQLSRKKRLIILEFSGTRSIQVSDAIMPHVAGLADLQQLNLRNTHITTQGLRHLAHLESLEMLYLSGTKITDEGLGHLSRLTKLWLLDIGNNKITDKGLVHLRSLRKLNTLWLNDTNITDAGLVQLTPLKDLRELRLDGTKVTGENLGVLMGCPALAQLDIERTPVGLQELRALQHHPALEQVDLFLSDVAATNPEWEQFWRTLPFVKARAAKLEALRNRSEKGKKTRGELPFDVMVEVVKVGKHGKEAVAFDQARLAQRRSIWQEYLNSSPAKFNGYRETMLDSLSRYRGTPQVHLVFDANRPFEFDYRFVHKGREIISIRGHKHSSFCSRDNRLFFADYSPDMPGCAVVAYDLISGKELWKTKLHQEQPKAVSAYRNHVKVSLTSDPSAPGQQWEKPGNVIEVRGSETYCDYIEALDAETGASLAIKNYRVGFDAPANATSDLDSRKTESKASDDPKY